MKLRATAFLALSLLPFTVALHAADPARKNPLADQATPLEGIKVLVKDFKVELLYSVPRDTQGSWVNMTVDPKGRLIVSDQHGKLYRVTPPPVGKTAAPTLEPIDLPIGGAHGLVYAFDSLYVMVSEGKAQGLYRVRDTDGDDRFDDVKLLRAIEGKGEHGPHAILRSPDGKSLYVCCGNHTKLTKLDGSLPAQVWDEDQLLPRMWDAKGHARGILAPGGWIARTDPEGQKWELFCNGFRNEFDAAFNRDGELFTYDSDMEWDMNTPWYRPTRVCHCVSAAEFGWRSGSGKWPVYYPDSLPPVYDVGPGSPTGVTFGYGAKFPAKYQDALFLCDWSYGKLYAAHLKPDGASYKAELEELLNGIPLPLTDIVVNDKDGAIYFTIGGRKTQSGLYRLTYTGKESTAPAARAPGTPEERAAVEARAQRRALEAFHGRKDPKAVGTAWPYLRSTDRFLRYAARVALEHQDVGEWQEKALAERDPDALLAALLALVRVGDKALQPRILGALSTLQWDSLNDRQRLELLRVWGLAFIRMGKPDELAREQAVRYFDPHYPAPGRDLNAELCRMLVYLEAPGVAAKTLELLEKAPTQEEQLHYAFCLRNLKTGWNLAQRKRYFNWFLKAANYRGGASFGGFVQNTKNDAVATLTPEEKTALKAILEARPTATEPVYKPRPFVRKWTVDDLVPAVQRGLTKRNFERGRQLFAEAKCFACHRFNNEGGIGGPDLTAVSGRFNIRDLVESLVEPSKVISDQYAAVIITTRDDRIVTGRIVNLAGEVLKVNTDMLNPNGLVDVKRKDVESIKPSPTSMMPAGLLDSFHEDEVLDLIAYLLSRGDPRHKMFQ
jgi:putative heme-binding domain-containing protein